MREPLRLATPEEIEKVRKDGDLTSESIVLAMSHKDLETDLAVVRRCVELDPVYFAETSNTSRRATFIWGIENYLRLQGFPEYYFDVLKSATPEWVNIVEKWGGKCLSTDFRKRYKKVL